MAKISDIDKNFRSNDIGDTELEFHNIRNQPFDITGFAWLDEDGVFCRMPQAQLPDLPPAIQTLSVCTAGGMVRFRTNSPTIAIKAELNEPGDLPHMPRTGSAGFDLYLGTGLDKSFVRQAAPATANDTDVAAVIYNCDKTEMLDCTINFPLYKGVKKVFIGLAPGCKLEPPTPFTIEKPIVFYGSSITQGGCASRPGNAFTHHIARWHDANLVNLGFSGNAKGEPEMAELIASLDMSAFVMDYDYNATVPEHLAKTHEPFFKIIRAARPTLPIVMVSAPYITPRFQSVESMKTRRDIVRKTYDNAIAAGDKNVYHVDGSTLMGTDCPDACTVDSCHPNDLGFWRMAKGINPAVTKALG